MIRQTCCAAALFSFAIGHPALAQDIPAKLAPPPGTVLIGAYKAVGVQIYVCAAQGSASGPVLKAPDAQLIDNGKAIARHYTGPTWEAADGSKVVGKMIDSAPAPTEGAIPWLLLTAQSTGQGIFEGARFVQRIETSGGTAPTTACPPAGAEWRVPYTATYRFFR
jgi:hypothetical protein